MAEFGAHYVKMNGNAFSLLFHLYNGREEQQKQLRSAKQRNTAKRDKSITPQYVTRIRKPMGYEQLCGKGAGVELTASPMSAHSCQY